MTTFDPELATTIDVKAALEALIKSHGWEWLSAQIKIQVEMRRQAIVYNPLGDDGLTIYRQEYMKGEVNGMETVMALAVKHLDVIKEELEALTADEEDEEDAR